MPRPGYKILRDIFATEQNSERADVFICKVRALLSKLPYVVPEVMKLDIVYGMLDRRIRKRVCRDSFDGLEQLITKVRLVEESLAEVSSPILNNNTSSIDSCAARDRSDTNPSPSLSNTVAEPVRSKSSCSASSLVSLRDAAVLGQASTSNVCNNSDVRKRTRPKCSYCKLFGHSVDNCRNKKEDTSSSNNNTQLRCYGCGQLGVVRSKCDKCESTADSSKVDFCSTYIVGVSDDDSQPLIGIEVVDRKGVAILDTGATHSIASPTLHALLVNAGVMFRTVVRTVGLADGSQQKRTALECDVDVTLGKRVISTTFMVLPNARTRTLLGRNFIMKANILLDLPQCSWRFNDESSWHPFAASPAIPTTDSIKPRKPEASELLMMDDEGTAPTANQRVRSNGSLLDVTDRSAKKEPSTNYTRFRVKSDTSQELHRLSSSLRVASMQGEGPEERPTVTNFTPYLRRTSNAPFDDRKVRGRNRVSEKRSSGAGDLLLLKTQGSDDAPRGQIPRSKSRRILGSGENSGKYRVLQLTPFVGDVLIPPDNEKRRRGRPKRFLD